MPIPPEHKTWFEEVCKEATLKDITTACEESGLVIDNVPFVFAKDMANSEDALLVQAVVGFLPKQGALPILRRILEVQLLTAGPSAPIFGLEPGTGALVIVSCIFPSTVHPQEMVLALRVTAQAAMQWKEEFEKPGSVQANSLQKNMKQRQGKPNHPGAAE